MKFGVHLEREFVTGAPSSNLPTQILVASSLGIPQRRNRGNLGEGVIACSGQKTMAGEMVLGGDAILLPSGVQSCTCTLVTNVCETAY